MGEYSRIYKGDLSDRQLASLWEMLRASGRDRDVMFGLPPMDGPAFVQWLRSKNLPMWLITFRGEPCGLFFIEDHQGKTAKVHFCTYPMETKRTGQTPVGRIPATLGFGLYFVGSALWERNVSGGFILDTLIGIIPSCKPTAIKAAVKVGSRVRAEIPGMCWCYDTGENVPGVVLTMTRDDFPEWTATI